MKLVEIEKHLNDFKRRQNSIYSQSFLASSIDTEAILTDRKPSLPVPRFSSSFYCNSRNLQEKPYKVEDYFPKPFKSSLETPNFSNKENFKASILLKKEFEEPNPAKDSFRNPMISIENPSSRSSSPYHERQSTADFSQCKSQSESIAKVPSEQVFPYSNPKSNRKLEKKVKNNKKTLRVCTCILAGSIYTHKRNCKKVDITVLEGPVKKRFSVVEACIKIQRTFRKFLAKSSKLTTGIIELEKIDFALFADTSNARSKKQVISSILSSYNWSEMYSDEKCSKDRSDTEGSESSLKWKSRRPQFLENMIVNSEMLKNCRSDLEESIDFELSGTFK